jgi:hypothetical protein
VRYGITKPIASYNPFWVFAHEYVAIVRDIRGDRTWSDRLARLWRGPGWAPEAVAVEASATS